mmetsp:Transcript_46249/g.76899  ORF Transcript_46249/g.76899 Transcript_46249/m.76899 type:complete len:274 (-) Transcript_46249:57-878(-)
MAFIYGKLCLYAGGFIAGSSVTFNPIPFSEGSTKQAHEAIYNNDHASTNKGDRAVVKKHLQKNGNDKSPLSIKREFEKEVASHKLAAHFAAKWNMISHACSDTERKPIHVNIPYIAQIWKRDDFLSSMFGSLHSNGEYIIVEDYLNGRWEKFNSNTGWVHDHNECIQAFSHWTYHVSDGKYLVCDLQGIVLENDGGDDTAANGYQVTDPCIMSQDDLFGVTDLGIAGISNWFYHHECNEFCDPDWKKPDVIEKSDDIECDRETATLRLEEICI